MSENEAVKLYRTAMSYLNANQIEQALNTFQQSVKVARQIGDKLTEGRSLYGLGLIYDNSNQMQQAFQIYQETLRVQQSSGDQRGEVVTHLAIGNLFYRTGDYDNSVKEYQQGLTIAQSFGTNERDDQRVEGMVLSKLGEVYGRRGENEQALEHFEKSLELFEALQDRNSQGMTLGSIGTIHMNLGKYDEALDYFQQALKLKQSIGDKLSEAVLLNNIGILYRFKGEFDKSLESMQKALSLAQASRNVAIEALVLNSLGELYIQWEQTDQALEYFQKSLSITRQIGDKFTGGFNLNNIAMVYHQKQQYEKAVEILEESLQLARDIGNKIGEGLVLDNLGVIYLEWKKYDKALEYCKESLAIRKQIGDRSGEGNTLDNLGSIYLAKRNYKQALEYFNQSLAIAQELGNKSNEGVVLSHLGELYKKQQEYTEAIKYFKKAFSIKDLLSVSAPSSDMRRSARAELMGIVGALIPCFIETGQNEEALAYLEHNKGREMVIEQPITGTVKNKEIAQLTDQITSIDNQLQELFYQFQRLQKMKENLQIQAEEFDRRVKPINSEIQTLSTQRRELQQKLWLNHPTQGTVMPPDPLELVEVIQDSLVPRWLLLDFYYNEPEEELHVFVLTKDQPVQVFTKTVDVERMVAINSLSQAIIDKRREVDEKLAAGLDEDSIPSLLKEFEKVLQRTGNVLHQYLFSEELNEYLKDTQLDYLTIIPTSFIHALPLELIHDGTDYLGLKYNLSRAFNLQTIRAALASKEEESQPFFLGVGDPTAEIENLDLPYAAEEVQELYQLSVKKRIRANRLLRKGASERAFLNLLNQNKYTVVHFAGHAIFNQENPTLSHLLLRQGNNISELYGNELPVKTTLSGHPLVVLSACETGGMVSTTGDEIFGLARGFIEAGATGLAMSGWQIFDNSAKDFYVTFYSHYFEGKATGESLRLAREQIIKNAQEGTYGPEDVHLIHWGAFRYYGLPL